MKYNCGETVYFRWGVHDEEWASGLIFCESTDNYYLIRMSRSDHMVYEKEEYLFNEIEHEAAEIVDS